MLSNRIPVGIADVESGDGDRPPLPRSFSNPAINNYFDNKDQSSNVHIAHDRETAKTLAHLTEFDHHTQATTMDVLDDEVCKVARRLEALAQAQKKTLSKRSAREKVQEPSYLDDAAPFYRQCVAPLMFALAGICIIVVCIVWNDSGTLHHELGVAHVHTMRTRKGFMKSPLYSASERPGNLIELQGRGSEVFDVRILLMAGQVQRLRDEGISNESSWSPSNGTLHYSLLADGEVFHTESHAIESTTEQEIFQTIDVAKKVGHSNARHFHVHVWADTADGQPVAFLCQVMQMGALARHRFWIGATIFLITLVAIVSEVIHRVYSAFIGTIVMHFVIASIQDTPRLTELATTIDFGSLMLLFSMMIMMHMLSLTGFFEWFTIQLVRMSGRSPVKLFFLLSNGAGILSAFLDSATVILLMGPIAFSLAEETGLRSMPFYLAITLAASIGGAATMIGDPPNIVIHSQMDVGFESFLMFNGPLVLIMLPLSTLVLYLQFRGSLVDASRLDEKGLFQVDLFRLQLENQITDMESFRGILAILAGIMISLITSPLHGIDPAWFCMMGMLVAATVYHKHQVEDLLLAVEWDTLLFFAILFVLVETLQELGLMHQLGDAFSEAILSVPEGSRMFISLAAVLWISAIGSAFAESLPLTCILIGVLLDLKTRNLPGMDVDALTWSLSIGACIGGIGSIMGSFTNVTAVAISDRYGKNHEDKVLYHHFLRYGFPLLVLLTAVGTLYHWLIFEGFGFKGATAW